VVIVPNVGHTEGQFSAEYIIEPYKGVSVNVPSLSPIVEKRETNSEINAQNGSGSNQGMSVSKSEVTDKKEEMVFSNIYSYDDFQLILNNQIALYKSTGQSFNLVSFQLDPAAQVKGLLSMNQLKNAISRSILKKDKLCSQDDRIYILVVRSTPQNISEILNKLKFNLPSKDVSYLKAIANYIKIYDIEISEDFSNSSEMLDLVQSEQGGNAHSPLSEINW
jgi:circadian clock protein KaiC